MVVMYLSSVNQVQEISRLTIGKVDFVCHIQKSDYVKFQSRQTFQKNDFLIVKGSRLLVEILLYISDSACVYS